MTCILRPLLAGALVLLVSGGCEQPAARSVPQAEPGATRRPAPNVQVQTVRPQPFTETLAATGTLRAAESVELQAEADGRVVAIHFRDGSHVNRGDLLLKINDAELQASLQRATQRRELAAVRERRIGQLAKERIATQDDYDAARSEVAVQDADIALIRAQIAKTEIRAPFDGTIGLRHVSRGAFLSATTRVATLQQVDQLNVDFSVPERHVGRVLPGMKVRFQVAGVEQPQAATILAVDPRADVATGSLLVRARYDNAKGRLYPGTFASVELDVATIAGALLVPAEAVLPDIDGSVVFVLQGDKAIRRTVQLGARTASAVQVLAGLEPGDRLIVNGLQQLRDAMTVVPMEAPARSAALNGRVN